MKDLWGECGQECRSPGSEDAGREGAADVDAGQEAAVPPVVAAAEEEEEGLLAPPGDGGEDEASTQLKKLRAEIRTADRHEREVAREVEDLEEEAQANLGPDGEYQPLWGRCFTLPHAQYTYEMCVGGEAQQKEGKGRGTGLGQWDGIQDEGVPDSSQGLPGKAFVFKHGDHCWNGPARSLRVTLFCSVEEKLSEVDEPATCEYGAFDQAPRPKPPDLTPRSAPRRLIRSHAPPLTPTRTHAHACFLSLSLSRHGSNEVWDAGRVRPRSSARAGARYGGEPGRMKEWSPSPSAPLLRAPATRPVDSSAVVERIERTSPAGEGRVSRRLQLTDERTRVSLDAPAELTRRVNEGARSGQVAACVEARTCSRRRTRCGVRCAVACGAWPALLAAKRGYR